MLLNKSLELLNLLGCSGLQHIEGLAKLLLLVVGHSLELFEELVDYTLLAQILHAEHLYPRSSVLNVFNLSGLDIIDIGLNFVV